LNSYDTSPYRAIENNIFKLHPTTEHPVFQTSNLKYVHLH